LEARRQGPPRGARPAAEEREAVEKQAVELLRPEQARRLGQMLRQQVGVWAFEEEAVALAIGLTPAQRRELEAIQNEAMTTYRADVRGDRPHVERVLQLFTPAQKARWREQVGEPFEGFLPPGQLVLSLGRLELYSGPVGAHLLVSDRLTRDDPEYKNRPGRPHKVHTARLHAGKTYQIDLMSKSFDAYLYLEDAAGNVLMQDDDSGGGLNARLIFRPARTDDYRIIATAYNWIGRGTYALTVVEQPPAVRIKVVPVGARPS
jgi:hypothetical protein